MIRYELQKIFSRPAGKAALLLLALVVGVTCYFACHVKYVDEAGQGSYGLSAVRQLRADQKAWAGVLDESLLRRVLQTHQEIVQSPEYQSEDVVQNDMAYHDTQGYTQIHDLINQSFAAAFRSYDYYTINSLTPEDAPRFYSNRIDLLRTWLTGSAGLTFSPAEKAFLLDRYEAFETPITVDYVTGWAQLYEYAPTVQMIVALIACFLVAGLFSSEAQWKTDAIFFSTLHGRRKATAAKVGTGLLVLTAVYWAAFLLFAAVTLLFLGADGAGCPVQVTIWKSFYTLTLGQGALLIALGGYLGVLFLGLVTMWISAKLNSAVVAAIFPFAAIFLPSLLLDSSLLSDILGLLPDRLLQINRVLGYFDLYRLGDQIVPALPILLILYLILTLLLVPLLYQTYRTKQLK